MLFSGVGRGWSASRRKGSCREGHGGARLSFHAQAQKAVITGRWWLVGGDGVPRSRGRERRRCPVRTLVMGMDRGSLKLVGAVIAGIAPGWLSSGRSVVPHSRGPAVSHGSQVGGGHRRRWWSGPGLAVAGRPQTVDHPSSRRVERSGRGPSRGSAGVGDQRSGVSTRPVAEVARVAKRPSRLSSRRRGCSRDAVSRSPIGSRSAVAGRGGRRGAEVASRAEVGGSRRRSRSARVHQASARRSGVGRCRSRSAGQGVER